MPKGVYTDRQYLAIIAKGVLNGFEAARIDNGGNPSYLGYISKTGYYYIQKIDTATGTVTYYSDPTKIGVVSLDSDWTNRATRTYQEYTLVKINTK